MKSLRELFWWGVFAIIALIGLAAVGSHYAKAMELRCAPREVVQKNLHNQEMASIGITGQGWLLELYRNDEGHWTMFLIDPKDPDYMCFLANGGEWADAEKPSY